ncbi:hypothetical protein H6G20_26155 [Desertifilum sp. FACHB-1129]|uniref:Uncharacterized protein n=1 Tax=Desertifilum tharense IPPAS B-1220 TaxID=1781255 RepID=A0A1E5QDE6_9CYAN|nr:MULTISPECIES: hypothetical protein [Desertifilum]MDA0213592.1 hypothetical protein [Cyanobacteria bacterium FC1]MBD2315155.1 hypothetical protein [Desertifilum sp. FACHB-1129]MBD2325196.1 hypothetical protein [Desertifilum sp. FACHB-866]MBD2335278.1 hypothetical protein [Desertifilum sp. FACHB-868]OEJ72685.1 hypothetical protein BH720_23745 [Desertifilum tharense IPPAS B-1220]
MYELLPVFCGYLISGGILFYCFQQKKPRKILFSSLFFLVSSFIFGNLNIAKEPLKNLVDFPGANILTTVLGITIGILFDY